MEIIYQQDSFPVKKDSGKAFSIDRLVFIFTGVGSFFLHYTIEAAFDSGI